ncbi:hypothetical protein GCM10020000_48250 [Streptomyces olivoverticillatus]
MQRKAGKGEAQASTPSASAAWPSDDVQHDGLGVNGEGDAGGQGDVLGQDGGTGLQARDGDGDGLGDVGGLGLDRQGGQGVLQQVAARGQLALGVDRNLDGDLLAALDDQQVDVDQEALERVTLDLLGDDQLVAALDVQGEQDVGGVLSAIIRSWPGRVT